MQLSQKGKKISEFFSVFYEFRLNFEQFEKKDDLHSLCVWKLQTAKDVLRQMPKNSFFRRPLTALL